MYPIRVIALPNGTSRQRRTTLEWEDGGGDGLPGAITVPSSMCPMLRAILQAALAERLVWPCGTGE